MTLLITVFAAVIATYKWYTIEKDYKINTLCYLYWGASIMWLVDAFFEFGELHAEYFEPAPADLLNDAFLGFTSVAIGLVIWIIVLLVSDPQGRIRRSLEGRTAKSERKKA